METKLEKHLRKQSAVEEQLTRLNEKPREHKLGCDEMHGHMAPKCCSPSCWCLPLRSFEKNNPNNALTRWEVTSKKLNEDQRARIDSFIHTLEARLLRV